jgi:hypothetical protein
MTYLKRENCNVLLTAENIDILLTYVICFINKRVIYVHVYTRLSKNFFFFLT